MFVKPCLPESKQKNFLEQKKVAFNHKNTFTFILISLCAKNQAAVKKLFNFM